MSSCAEYTHWTWFNPLRAFHLSACQVSPSAISLCHFYPYCWGWHMPLHVYSSPPTTCATYSRDVLGKQPTHAPFIGPTCAELQLLPSPYELLNVE
ncbi:rCG35859 [Rattus norvegicus]|uniref:RCG35859 n=1 Tax=Rattus norvegicus TaxID=10116 RepID=A6IK42_RAT|nr:rCG35859 [Rattus norvegicus]